MMAADIRRALSRRAADAAALARPVTLMRLLTMRGHDRYANALIAAKVEDLLSDAGGTRCRYVTSEVLGVDRARRRSYARFVFSCPAAGGAPHARGIGDRRRLELFVKRGPGVSRPDLEEFLGGRGFSGFSVPRFHGHTRVNGVRVGVWDFVAGRHPRFAADALDDMKDVVAAVAGMACVTESDLAHVPVVGDTPHWMRPIAGRLEILARRKPEQRATAELLRLVEPFARAEEGYSDRFAGMGPKRLAHNDIKADNIFVQDDGSIVLADWNSARLGYPGTSLRFLANWKPEPARVLVAHYIDRLASLGIRVAVADVRFSIRATDLLKNLSEAVDRSDLPRLGVLLRRARLE